MSYLNAITPLNIAEEKEKFFSWNNYSPQLMYKWDKVSIMKCKETIPRMSSLFNALINQNTMTITSEASRLFDVTFRSQDRVTAKTLIKDISPSSNGTAQELATVLVRKFAELEIDYKVEIVDRHGFQCRPDHKARLIRLSKHLHLQFYSIKDVANHELVHIIRAVNGNYNNIHPMPDYLPTEEGVDAIIRR